MTNLLDKAKLFAGGLNWQALLLKVAVVAVVAVSIYSVGYTKGKAGCQVKHAEVAAETAKQETITIVKEVEKRVPVVQVQEVESAKLKAKLALTEEKLRAALQTRPDVDACKLSDDERLQWNEIANSTRK